MSAARIIVRLMYEVEYLRFENGQYRIALFGCEVKPESPFPLLGGEDVLAILHPEHRRGCR